MGKPLNENLRNVRVETEEGDLLPIMDVAGAKFSELKSAVGDETAVIATETGYQILSGRPEK